MKYFKLFFIGIIVCMSFSLCKPAAHQPDEYLRRAPRIFPDYTNTVFPVNIAPPNFKIQERGETYQVEIGTGGETAFVCESDGADVIIPQKKWHALLDQAKGRSVFFRITVCRDGKWVRYSDIINSISPISIDPYLVYRKLYPGYEQWNEMGIYQRDISSYDEKAIVENKSINHQCVNCHTFCKNSPDNMILHIRGKNGGTLIFRNNKMTRIDLRNAGLPQNGVYCSWHPSGRYIAFSTNDIKQFFHFQGRKPIEVVDLKSDVVVYDVAGNRILNDGGVLQDSVALETFPAWSPDGRTLFFCRAKSSDCPIEEIRYDLCKVSFDARTRKIGKATTLYEAARQKQSVSFPRVSPDGKYLMFTVSAYGNFSIWHPESDLFLMNLTTGKVRRLDEVNSANVESCHSWSSNGRWFVFSSKRMDGLSAFPHISFFDSKTGKAAKPFMLPQENPSFYQLYMKTFNLPEFIKSPVTIGSGIVRMFSCQSGK